MERAVYAVEDAIEERHWWFAGRRRLFARELRRAGIAADARILDIGTSTGTNLRLLRELGLTHVTGLDNSEDAIRFCRDKGLGPVERGDVLAMPFADGSFDLVLATDIIEHVDDDGRALGEIRRVLRPGGQAVLTVPAFAALWGLQDRVAQHRRRYRLAPLRRAVQAAGLRPRRAFYFNYLLFLPILLARRLIDALGIDVCSEAEINTPLINRLLAAIFRCDIATAPWLKPPFGVSILMLAEKPGAAPARG
jgi:SAM-dependent methyltransferase